MVASRRRAGRGSARIRFGFAVISVYVVAAIFGPWLVALQPGRHPDRGPAPAAVQPVVRRVVRVFGTDQVGQDLLAQMLQGARISIAVGLATLVLAGAIGVLVGLAAGYFGGWLDGVLMRLADIQLAFPSILLAIFIAALLGPSVVNVVIVLACRLGHVRPGRARSGAGHAAARVRRRVPDARCGHVAVGLALCAAGLRGAGAGGRDSGDRRTSSWPRPR